MKTSNIVWIVIVVVVVLGGLYYLSVTPAPYSNPTDSVGLNDQTNTGQGDATSVLNVSTSPTLGSYLVAANGMTLYLFTKDTLNVTNCYDDCAVKWPPYISTDNVPLIGGAGATGTLSTITRKDGAKQITYNGIPLYYWYLDVIPGDTLGQNVGGVWFVVKP
jgi:predicted lipoprotein with Yx(FWY)xxD motif